MTQRIDRAQAYGDFIVFGKMHQCIPYVVVHESQMERGYIPCFSLILRKIGLSKMFALYLVSVKVLSGDILEKKNQIFEPLLRMSGWALLYLRFNLQNYPYQ